MYKECKVVMLTTNEKAKSHLFINSGGTKLMLSNGIGNHALYITSNYEIKINDWYIDRNNTVQECKSIKDNILTGPKTTIVATGKNSYDKYSTYYDCKKIIATTDTSLTYNLNIKNVGGNYETVSIILPNISQSFIDEYITEYNKSNIITDVLVEYEWVGYDGSKNQDIFTLKVDNSNCITIKKKENKLYPKEEVIQLLRDVLYQSPYLITTFPDGTVNSIKPKEFDSWVKENLK